MREKQKCEQEKSEEKEDNNVKKWENFGKIREISVEKWKSGKMGVNNAIKEDISAIKKKRIVIKKRRKVKH